MNFGAKFQQKFILIDGVRYAVTLRGVGQPLMLLHGFTGSGTAWGDIGDQLADSFCVITLDLIGHGATTAPRDPARAQIERAAADVQQVCAALHLPRIHLVGYSMGGRLALAVALHYPALIASLTLESASPGLADADERAARAASDEALATRIERDGVTAFVAEWEALPLFASQRRLPSAVRDRLRAERLRRDPAGLALSLRGMGTGRQPSYWEDLPRLTVPTLLIAGADDAKYAALAEDMAGRLPRSYTAIVRAAGHTVHLEQPDQFAALVRLHAMANQSAIK